MFKLYWRKVSLEIFSLKFLGILCIFNFIASSTLKEAKILEINCWEYMILLLTDHYYILYFFFITYIFFQLKIMFVKYDLILIRSTKFINVFVKYFLSNIIFILIYILAHSLIAFILGWLFLPRKNTFSSILFTNNKFSEIMDALQYNFASPLQALLAILGFMAIGLIFISLLLNYSSIILNKKITIYIILILYIGTILALKTQLDNTIPYLFLNNYFILHHALAKKLVLKILFIIILVSFLLLYSLYNLKRIHLKKQKTTFTFWYLREVLTIKKLIITILIVGSIIFLSAIFLKDFTLTDLLLYNAWGYGTGYFQNIEFLQFFLLNSIPIYIIGIFCANESLKNSYLIIRMKNPKNWIYNSQKAYLIFFILYILIQLLFCIIFGLLLGKNTNGYLYIQPFLEYYYFNIKNIFFLLIIVSTLRIFELMVIQIIFMILLSITKNPTISFIIYMSFYLLLFFNISIYYPIGISSFNRILISNDTLYYIKSILVLGIVYFTGYLYLIKYGARKLFY